MKKSVLYLIFSQLVLVMVLNLNSGCSSQDKILLVTGGHDFDTAEFFNLFLSNSDLSVDTVSQPLANILIGKMKSKKYDCIVFYDMWQEITQAQKEGYQRLLENGTGILFLHHSLVSYQDWDEFTDIRGGKYREKGYTSDSSDLSGYEHDLDLEVNVIEHNHPITKGIHDFSIKDEGYYNVEILPSVTPLLGTSHPSCARYVAWTNEYKKSRVVYIMLGHDRQAYDNPSFRQLIYNSINWVTQSSQSRQQGTDNR
jgi:type 1 glutamine amidotransferase